mgnify:CR=1 FL=1
MTCPFPTLNIPPEFANTETTTVSISEDRKSSLDFTLGFILDGVEEYKNISEAEGLNGTKVRLVTPTFKVGNLDPYNADKDDPIKIEVIWRYDLG